MLYKLVTNLESKDEIVKCGRSLLELVENDSDDSFQVLRLRNYEMLKCKHSNEICGVVLLFVVSKSNKVNLRLRNELNFA